MGGGRGKTDNKSKTFSFLMYFSSPFSLSFVSKFEIVLISQKS